MKRYATNISSSYWIDPQSYPDPTEITDICTVDLAMDEVIVVNADGSFIHNPDSQGNEDISWLSWGANNRGIYVSDTLEIYANDVNGVREDAEEMLRDYMPETPSTYHVKGNMEMYYEVYDIFEYPNGSIDDSYSKVEHLKDRNRITNFEVSKIR